MSVCVNIDSLIWEIKQKMQKELEIKIESKYGMGQPRYIYPFEIDNDILKLPFSYAVTNLKFLRPDRDSFSKMTIKFTGLPRPEQKLILKEALELLSNKGSVMISAYPGFGKTMCSINLACAIKFKTLIIVNKIILIKQWEESILKFCINAKIQKLTPKSVLKADCDFYIINAQNVEKMGKSFFSDIGTVIVDEAHMIMAETLSKSMQYVYPRYLIGLSATPYRPDGLDKLLEFYFGKYKIIRKLFREHVVYKISTGFKPTIEYSANGRVNWGVVLDSQAGDQDRNDLIIKLLCYFSDRNFLVLVKRVSQGEYLVEKLRDLNEDVTSLFGSNQEFNATARILIGTNSKIGVGFDHSRLNALLLAADVEEYFIQYLGRVFRTEEVEPIVLDLVDNYCILEKHWSTRKKIYHDHGGTIKNFDITILNE